MSRKLVTMPRTAGSSSLLRMMLSTQTHEPSLRRDRDSVRIDSFAGSLARSRNCLKTRS